MPSATDLNLLRSEIDTGLSQVAHLTEELETWRDGPADSASQHQLRDLGYLLHSVYTGWESILHRIAQTFENSLDPERWHQHLIERMCLSIPNMRPEVVTTEMRSDLVDLQKFQHFFRHSYAVLFRADKMRPLVAAYHRLAGPMSDALQRFTDFLAECERKKNEK